MGDEADLTPRADSPHDAFRIGMRVGPYEVVRKLGEGGMGQVYLAKDHSLDDCLVALKVISDRLADDELHDRFRREIKNLSRLRHSRIVRILTAGTHEGHPYFVMDYVPGRDLGKFLSECSHPSEQHRILSLLKMLADVARTVHYAHTQRVAHRDLKPTNIIVADETSEAVVLDFGLAKHFDDTSLTVGSRAPGTPLYCAPEQIDKRLTLREELIDVWALGVILYEALTGKPPFAADNFAFLSLQILRGIPERPRELKPSIPAEVERVVLACIEKNPRRRPATADKLAAFLERCAQRMERSMTAESEQSEPAGAAGSALCGDREPAAQSRVRAQAQPCAAHRPHFRRWAGLLLASLSVICFVLALHIRPPPPEPSELREEITVTKDGVFLGDLFLGPPALGGPFVDVPLETSCEVISLKLRAPRSKTSDSIPVRWTPRAFPSTVEVPLHEFQEDGEYSLFVAGRQGPSERFEAKKRLTVERASCHVVDITPPAGSVLEKGTGTLRGRVVAKSQCRIRLDGRVLDLGEDGTFGIPLDAGRATHCLLLESLDRCFIVPPLVCTVQNHSLLTGPLWYMVQPQQTTLTCRLINNVSVEGQATEDEALCVVPGEQINVEYDFLGSEENGQVTAKLESSAGPGSIHVSDRPDGTITLTAPDVEGVYSLTLDDSAPTEPTSIRRVAAYVRVMARNAVLVSVPEVVVVNKEVSEVLTPGDLRTLKLRPPAFILITQSCGSVTCQVDGAAQELVRFGDKWTFSPTTTSIGGASLVSISWAGGEVGARIEWGPDTLTPCRVCVDRSGFVRCTLCGSPRSPKPGARRRGPCSACNNRGLVPCSNCRQGWQPMPTDHDHSVTVSRLEESHRDLLPAKSALAGCEVARRNAREALWRPGSRCACLRDAVNSYEKANQEYWKGRVLFAEGQYLKSWETITSATELFLKHRPAMRSHWDQRIRQALEEKHSELTKRAQAELNAERATRRDALLSDLQRSLGDDAVLSWSEGDEPPMLTLVGSWLGSSGVDPVPLNSQACEDILHALRKLGAAEANDYGVARGIEVKVPGWKPVLLFPEAVTVLERSRNPQKLLQRFWSSTDFLAVEVSRQELAGSGFFPDFLLCVATASGAAVLLMSGWLIWRRLRFGRNS